MKNVCLELREISKYYVSGRNVTAALKNVSLMFQTGEFVAITGESGSGKSTMAHVMAGIIPFESGELLFNGESTSQYSEAEWEDYRRDNISFVAQNYGVLPGNTVFDNVICALKLAGLETDGAKRKARSLLRKVDLWKQRKRRAARLSSGQKQRLSIARALAKEAPILIADEPTGNLDPENSRKVVSLLAEAAKTRLVIMITHDFKASADQVTRRVAINDGVVRNDQVFSENCGQEEDGFAVGAADESGKVSYGLDKKRANRKNRKCFRLSGYVAALQLKARPAWTGFMVAFFALTAFGVFAFLGTFMISLDDTHTKIYDNEAFINGDERRLVAVKLDGRGFTEADYEKMMTLEWAESLERFDAVKDINYYYREDVDYKYRTFLDMSDKLAPVEAYRQVILDYNGNYVHTVPVMREGETFLKAGSLPQRMNEVVAVGDESLIGTSMPVFFLDRKNWGEGAYIVQEMTVVGVTDYGEGLYFDDSVGRMLYQSIFFDEWILGVNETLTGNQVNISDPLMQRYYTKLDDVLWLKDTNGVEKQLELSYHETNPSLKLSYMEVSQDVFDRYVYHGDTYQVSMTIQDYSYTDRAIRELRSMGFDAVSPYRIGSVRVNTALANERLTTLVLCMLALVVVIIAQICVLSAMFGLEMSSYKQLGDLGLSCRIGKQSVLWQVLVMTAVGQVIGIALIYIGAENGVERLFNVLKYLEPLHIAVICVLHLAASLLVAFAGGCMLKKQVFPYIRRSTDVDLAELEETEVEG